MKTLIVTLMMLLGGILVTSSVSAQCVGTAKILSPTQGEFTQPSCVKVYGFYFTIGADGSYTAYAKRGKVNYESNPFFVDSTGFCAKVEWHQVGGRIVSDNGSQSAPSRHHSSHTSHTSPKTSYASAGSNTSNHSNSSTKAQPDQLPKITGEDPVKEREALKKARENELQRRNSTDSKFAKLEEKNLRDGKLLAQKREKAYNEIKAWYERETGEKYFSEEERLQGEIVDRDAVIAEQDFVIDSLIYVNQQCGASADLANQQVSGMQNHLANKDTVIADLRASIAPLEAKLSTANQRITDLEKKVKTLEKERRNIATMSTSDLKKYKADIQAEIDLEIERKKAEEQAKKDAEAEARKKAEEAAKEEESNPSSTPDDE